MDTKKVMAIPNNTTAVRRTAPSSDLTTPEAEKMKNIVIIDISPGNLPLHGTKQFVSIAISLSRGESIMRQPTIPAALHPNPMHIVEGLFGYIKNK